MPKDKKQSIAHLLLAAGASTRMGQAKQLLPWNGKSLIQHAIQQIEAANIVARIVVVLGANKEKIVPELSALKVISVYNADWAEGMGTSVRAGIQHLLHDPTNWDAIMISLVDQPLIQSKHYQLLFQKWSQEDFSIIAAEYQDVLGVPAIFGKSQIPKLLELNGQTGARKLLMLNRNKVGALDMPEAQFDLDTPEDYEKLIPSADE